MKKSIFWTSLRSPGLIPPGMKYSFSRPWIPVWRCGLSKCAPFLLPLSIFVVEDSIVTIQNNEGTITVIVHEIVDSGFHTAGIVLTHELAFRPLLIEACHPGRSTVAVGTSIRQLLPSALSSSFRNSAPESTTHHAYIPRRAA